MKQRKINGVVTYTYRNRRRVYCHKDVGRRPIPSCAIALMAIICVILVSIGISVMAASAPETVKPVLIDISISTEGESVAVQRTILYEDMAETVVIEDPVVEAAPSDMDILMSNLGEWIVSLTDCQLVQHALPDLYYGDAIDYSSFQPWMDYRSITNTASQGYAVCNSVNAYTDSNGFRRYRTGDNEFSIDGEDDYIVALGTYYKEKGVIGNRYLIVTSEGMFTVRTGDEKADEHTDQYNMFTLHDGQAGVVEWIVDVYNIDDTVAATGNAARCENFTAIHGEILYIYEIQ